jgi:hypothetical protein
MGPKKFNNEKVKNVKITGKCSEIYEYTNSDMAIMTAHCGYDIACKYKSLCKAIVENNIEVFTILVNELCKYEPYLDCDTLLFGMIAHYARSELLKIIINKIIEIYPVVDKSYCIKCNDKEKIKKNSDDEESNRTVISKMKIIKINNIKKRELEELPADETMIDGEATNETKITKKINLGKPLKEHIHDAMISNLEFTCEYVLNMEESELKHYLMNECVIHKICLLESDSIFNSIVKYTNKHKIIQKVLIEIHTFLTKNTDINRMDFVMKNMVSNSLVDDIMSTYNYKDAITFRDVDVYKHWCEKVMEIKPSYFTPNVVIDFIKNFNCYNYLKILYDLHINLNGVGDNGENLLHIVNEVSSMELLINSGINCDQQTINKKQTPLMIAIKNGNYKCYDTLINKSNQMLTDVFGNTVLHYACRYTSYVAVKKLKLHNIENNFNMTPYDIMVNSMKVTYHVSRLKKNKEKHNNSNKIFATKIYNDYAELCLKESRIIISLDKTMETYNYIFDKLAEKTVIESAII